MNKHAKHSGFTLIELLVVVAVIILVAGITVPSIISLFTAGADAQAFNTFTAYLSATRALAIEKQTYTCLHVQLADTTAHPELENVCYVSIFIYSNLTPTNPMPTKRFVPVDGYEPRRMPGKIGFGEVSTTSGVFINAGGNYTNAVNTNKNDFTTFSIVFSPTGAIVQRVEGQPVLFYDQPFFDPPTNKLPNSIFFGTSRLWDAAIANNGVAGRPGVTAVTLFDLPQYSALADAGKADAYLNDRGQFLPLNCATGQLFPRK